MPEEPPEQPETGSKTPAVRDETRVSRNDQDHDFPPALQSLIELERQRIESANRRTDVVRLAIESNDASDKRQFEFRMAELGATKEARSQRHDLAKNIVFAVVGVGTVIIALLFGMAFFGTPQQSVVAIQILRTSGIGIAGYGLIAAIVRAASRMLKDTP